RARQREPRTEAVARASAAESVEGRAGAKGNTQQHNTYWTQSQARVTNALERIRPLSPSYTRGGSRMRESRTYGSVRGACDETHVPTATAARVHHAARRRGGRLAGGGEGAAAATQSSTYRRAYQSGFGRSGIADPYRSIPARPAGIGLDGWPQCAHRLPLGRWRSGAQCKICRRINCARPSRHPGDRPPDSGAVDAGYPYGADRIRAGP